MLGDRTMLLATTDTICGKTICKHLGMVRGNTIRARHIGRDIMAKLKNVVGGEISDRRQDPSNVGLPGSDV